MRTTKISSFCKSASETPVGQWLSLVRVSETSSQTSHVSQADFFPFLWKADTSHPVKALKYRILLAFSEPIAESNHELESIEHWLLVQNLSTCSEGQAAVGMAVQTLLWLPHRCHWLLWWENYNHSVLHLKHVQIFWYLVPHDCMGLRHPVTSCCWWHPLLLSQQPCLLSMLAISASQSSSMIKWNSSVLLFSSWKKASPLRRCLAGSCHSSIDTLSPFLSGFRLQDE